MALAAALNTRECPLLPPPLPPPPHLLSTTLSPTPQTPLRASHTAPTAPRKPGRKDCGFHLEQINPDFLNPGVISKATSSIQKHANLFLLHTNRALLSDVYVAGASSNFNELAHTFLCPLVCVQL